MTAKVPRMSPPLFCVGESLLGKEVKARDD